MKRRLPALLVAAALPLSLTACGVEDTRTEGETEAAYVNVGPIVYQVQNSRQLNPADPEDQKYLQGVPTSLLELDQDETFFAVFVRVQSEAKGPEPTAEAFKIVDTQDREYRSLPVDEKANPFAYEQTVLQPKGVLPSPSSVAAEGSVQGAMILFKLRFQSVADRPLLFEIEGVGGQKPHKADVNLDV